MLTPIQERGDVTSSKINPFVTETESGVYGCNSSTSQSFLQASGYTHTFTTGAAGVFGTLQMRIQELQFGFRSGSNVPVAIITLTIRLLSICLWIEPADTAKWTSLWVLYDRNLWLYYVW